MLPGGVRARGYWTVYVNYDIHCKRRAVSKREAASARGPYEPASKTHLLPSPCRQPATPFRHCCPRQTITLLSDFSLHRGSAAIRQTSCIPSTPYGTGAEDYVIGLESCQLLGPKWATPTRLSVYDRVRCQRSPHGTYSCIMLSTGWLDMAETSSQWYVESAAEMSKLCVYSRCSVPASCRDLAASCVGEQVSLAPASRRE